MRKKLLILLIFAMFLSITAIDFSSALAEDSSIVEISVDGSYLSYFDQDELIFSADYSLFDSSSKLSFTASSLNGQYTYVWQTKNGEEITKSATMSLYKTITEQTIANVTNENLASNLIMTGTTSYVLVATNVETNAKITKKISVVITQNEQKYDILTYSAKANRELITKISGSFKLYAFLPTAKAHSVNWYLKTPNGVSFDLIAANANEYEFVPSKLITDENGHGTYKIYAVAVEKSTNGKTFTSEMFEFVSMPSAPTVEINSYKIVSREVKNTKTKIQAFEYSVIEKDKDVASASVLDSGKILWYINGVLQTNGRTFKYEPTSTDVYNVTVKHLNNDGTIIQLASYREEPKSTGIGILLLIIAGAVVILVGIFSISVVVINKKRDVVW